MSDPSAQAELVRDEYGRRVAEIEQAHQESIMQIDGAYSRVTQYAGLVRTELMNQAVDYRSALLARAERELREALAAAGVPITIEEVPQGGGIEEGQHAEPGARGL